VHEDHELSYTVERLNSSSRVELRNILMVRTATYKEEYGDGKGGWHVERGASPKPLGGRWLELHVERKRTKDSDKTRFNAFTYKTM
jgi:hypothetical protein